MAKRGLERRTEGECTFSRKKWGERKKRKFPFLEEKMTRREESPLIGQESCRDVTGLSVQSHHFIERK